MLYSQEDCSLGLATPFNSGGYIADGVMFDVTATQNIYITGFTGNIIGSGNLSIYVKDGSYVGSETIAGNWTSLGFPNVAGNGPNVPTFIPFLISYPISAGSTKSFYITGNNTGAEFLYSVGTGAGNIAASNGQLTIFEGIGIEYPFTDTMYSPGVWNGIIHYGKTNTPNCTLLNGIYNDGTYSNGILFDVTATNSVNLEEIYMDFQSNFYADLRIYTRPGTHVGFEDDSTGWTYLGERFICNPTPDVASYTGIPLNTFIAAGNTQSFYVALINNSGHINYHYGTGMVGDVIYSDANIQIKSGMGKGGGLFVADNNSPRDFHGSIGYCTSLAGTEMGVSNQLSVFPTITNDVVNITNMEELMVSEIQILDMHGKVMQHIHPNTSQQLTINMQSFTAGVYILRIKTNKGSTVKKISKL